MSTHDLPTIAGWWRGADIDEKQSLALLTADAADAERAERQASKAALVDALARAGATPDAPVDASAPHDAAVTAAIHRFVGASAAALVLIQADDLAGEAMAVNLPGVDRERPNWRRRLGRRRRGAVATEAATQAIADFAAGRSHARR